MTPERQKQCIDALRNTPAEAIVVANIRAGEMLEFIAQRLPHTKLTSASAYQVEQWSGGLADCSCWFRGFEAAKGDDAGSLMPPGWRILSEINLALKSHLAAIGASNEREIDLPF